MKTHFTFSPVRMDEEYTLSVNKSVITVNGEVFDFTPLPEGALLPSSAVSSKWFIGDIKRINGDLHIMMILPHGANAPEARRFPQPVTLTKGGIVVLPEYDIVPVEPEPEYDEVIEDLETIVDETPKEMEEGVLV